MSKIDPINVGEFRRLAQRRLPKSVFDFVDGGVGDEVTARRNQSAYENVRLRPRVLHDVSRRDLSLKVVGEECSFPVLLAPTGVPRLLHHEGELAAARAAEAAGLPFVVSTAGSYSITKVAGAVDRRPWFQLFPCADREVTDALLAKAEQAGVRVLVVTVDGAGGSRRERDLRNTMGIPPQIDGRKLLQGATHPRWSAEFIREPRVAFANFADLPQTPAGGLSTAGKFALSQLGNWGFDRASLDEIRSRWRGPLIVKGVMSSDDALNAVEAGADAVVVSNHGGRSLDGVAATIEVLPRIVDSVNGRVEVLVDGGIRRGNDAAKAIALGAKAVLIGRPWLYGLVFGQIGVARVISLLRDEFDRTLAALGCTSPSELGRSHIEQPDPARGNVGE